MEYKIKSPEKETYSLNNSYVSNKPSLTTKLYSLMPSELNYNKIVSSIADYAYSIKEKYDGFIRKFKVEHGDYSGVKGLECKISLESIKIN